MLCGTAADMAAALLIHHQSSEQTTQVLGGEEKKNKKKQQPRPKQRARGPTYEAGFPACTQGAAGRVMTGLRVGGEGQS